MDKEVNSSDSETDVDPVYKERLRAASQKINAAYVLSTASAMYSEKTSVPLKAKKVPTENRPKTWYNSMFKCYHSIPKADLYGLSSDIDANKIKSLMTPEAATNQLTIIDHVQHNDSGTNPDQHSEIKHDSSNLISVDVENDANLSCQGKISDPKQQLKMRWFVRVKYDFQGQTSKELPVKKGDIVFIHRLRDDNWYEGECNGKSGLLPVCYVEPISDLQPHKDTIDEIAIAKFRFTALTNIELPLEKNQTVILLQRIDENWYEGKYPGTNRKGIFPVTYVEIIGKPPDDLICQQELRAYRHPRRLSYENNESGEQM